MRARGSKRLQSAMEYLMTYGWAILIIAVVLGALFQLGVFNAGTFAPHAPPGACQVLRPNGPNTATYVNLEGVCSGELPQYVAQFNGGADVVVSSTGAFPSGANPRTVTGWFLSTSSSLPSSGEMLFFYGTTCTTCAFAGWIGNGCSNPTYSVVLDTWGCTDVSATQTGPNTWTFFADVYDGSNKIEYVGLSGRVYSASVANTISTTSQTSFDIATGGGNPYLTGFIANIQVYNTSLTSSEVNALYVEGIGGAPIKLDNLVGWWPLNGNANDYSGNNNNGVPSGVSYTNQWVSGYTPP